MAILGGSPLGLIGVGSGPTRDGMSTFVGDKSRNVNVNDYNSGKSDGKKGNKSIFYGDRHFSPFPDMGINGNLNDDLGKDGYKSSKFHSNSLYDTSLLNIIEKLAGTKAQLRSQDFAYLKNVGVYPNNRLMIARRFKNPLLALNNIYRKGEGPLATMISWKIEGEDFFSIKFGEKWSDADADFTGILNEFGGDFSKKLGGLGGAVAGAIGSIPLPGFSESIQRSFLSSLGILNDDDKFADLPAGDPNLIKQAKKRDTIAAGSPGSGLNCTFSIKMVCEWEQKFISGIDPTLVWLDIIGLVLRFGTSKSTNYGLSPTASENIKKWVTDPGKLVDAIITAITGSINEFRTTLDSIVTKAGEKPVEKKDDKGNVIPSKSISAEESAKGLLDSIYDASGVISNEASTALKRTMTKYRERVIGIVNALSGLPSGPWHVTVGNPMRPVFTSGDLIIEGGDVTLTFGPILAFNDLPSSMRAEFSLVNARPLGMQEIMARFNSGYLRSISTAPASSEVAYQSNVKLTGSASTATEAEVSSTPPIPGPVNSNTKPVDGVKKEVTPVTYKTDTKGAYGL
jgi:hypothetical protein